MFARAIPFMLVVAVALPALAQTPAVAHRTFSRATGQPVEFAAFIDDLAKADVVFIGEQHNDASTHRFQRLMLEALAARRGDIVLALEMFERDTQEALEHFLMGHTEEAEFLQESRPWPRYATDYKPLVDLAIDRKWPVVAANVPRRIAADVSQRGMVALEGRPAADRAFVAADLQCPTGDEYYRRFAASMTGGHVAGAPPMDAATVDRYYFSQCVKDETMAESIAQAHAAGSIGGKQPLVVVVVGAFHSDFHQGTAARTVRRLPTRRVLVTTIVPVDTLDAPAPDAEARTRADYLVFSVK